MEIFDKTPENQVHMVKIAPEINWNLRYYPENLKHIKSIPDKNSRIIKEWLFQPRNNSKLI